MISFPVSDKKARALQDKMHALGCRENELEETFFRKSGVAIYHPPSGVRVRCARERSQALNRFLARRTLVEELEARRVNKTRHEVKAEEIRRQKGRPVPPTVKEQMNRFRMQPINPNQTPTSKAIRSLLERWQPLESERPDSFNAS
ncbi:MAG TPA: peptide chain release factor-like protein [Chthoniobacterales bacterium]|nr:peptide chain release factor-like protein [Chthoniobacterales bacterium]